MEDEEKETPHSHISIEPFGKNKLKISKDGKGFFILDPNKYDINTLMILIDLKKINKIESEFKRSENNELDGLDFIKTIKKELSVNIMDDPFDEINMIYGLYKLVCEIDLSGDKIIQWSEFTVTYFNLIFSNL